MTTRPLFNIIDNMSDAAGSEENNNMRIARGVRYPSPLGISNPRVLSDMGLAILMKKILEIT